MTNAIAITRCHYHRTQPPASTRWPSDCHPLAIQFLFAIALLPMQLPAKTETSSALRFDGTAVGMGGAAAGASVGLTIDGQTRHLDKESMLVVCEQKRVQVLTLAGEPLQIVSIAGSKTDLWSICSAGRFMYVTDRGASCVHVLAPPRMGGGAEAAKSRYMTMTPRKGARAAQAAQISQVRLPTECALPDRPIWSHVTLTASDRFFASCS